MNKKIVFCLFFSVLLLISSCSCEKNNNQSNEHANNNNLDTNKNPDANETKLVSSLPNSFVCFDKEYIENQNIQNENLNVFLGYLINFNDLEKWKDFDNDSNIVYAFDYNNCIIRIDYENKLTNRFELFYDGLDYKSLAVKNVTNDLTIFIMED